MKLCIIIQLHLRQYKKCNFHGLTNGGNIENVQYLYTLRIQWLKETSTPSSRPDREAKCEKNVSQNLRIPAKNRIFFKPQ